MNSATNSADIKESKGNVDVLDFRDSLHKYGYHWPMFLFSILLTVTLAFIYLRYTKPIYQVSAVLLIKDDKSNSPGTEILNQLDLFGSTKVVENELEILRSKTLMKRVVDRLHLNVSLIDEGTVINSIIYENKPFNFVGYSLDPKIYGKELVIKFKDSTQYTLQNLSTGEIIKGKFNRFERSRFGTFQINKTDFFKLHKDNTLKFVVKDPSKIIDNYLSRLSVEVTGKQSSVINLSFQSSIVKEGQDVLNTLIQVYNEASLADKNQITQSTINFIDERLGFITGELSEVEKGVEDFKSSNGLTDISNEANLYLEGVKVNDARLNEITLKLGVVNKIREYISSNLPQDELPSTFGIDDPVLLDQITRHSELQLQRDRLLETTQPDNPILEPLNKQIQTVRSSISSNINNIASSLEFTRKKLEGLDAQFKSSIRKIPSQERLFISIKRQQSIKESLYLYLLQKREEAALSYASTVADSRIVDEAYSSNVPIKPKKALTYILAALFGLVAPAFIIYIRTLLNTKIETLTDISVFTNTPVLGEILYHEGDEAIVVADNNRSAISEQFRAIRTNLQYIQGTQVAGLGKVTLFTSSMSGEGKSFVAANLAAALAISGRKTVLLELDLRKPKISKYLNLDNSIGLSNFLVGRCEINDIIRPSGISDLLYTIGSGPIPPNPSELLVQESLTELLTVLKKDFDEIIIDSPPIGLVTDAQIVGRAVDATIYIVRHKYTFKNQVSELDWLYKNQKLPNLNVILNGIKAGSSSAYGYSYGYGYGYYSDDHRNSKKGIKYFLKNFINRF